LAKLVRDIVPSQLAILIDLEAFDGKGRGLFIKSAEAVSATDVNVMSIYGRGIVSAGLRSDRAFALNLAPMASSSATARSAVCYLVSVEAAACTETGISTAERALTLRTIGSAKTLAHDLVTPGHIMPAIIEHQEDAVTAIESAALEYESRNSGALAIAWCDILDQDGEVASWQHCSDLSAELNCKLLVRRGSSAVDADAYWASKQGPEFKINASGIDLGQFA